MSAQSKMSQIPFEFSKGVDSTIEPKVAHDNLLGTKIDCVSVQDRTTALVRGLRLIMRHHGCDGFLTGEMNNQISQYLRTSGTEGQWLKRAKHVLTFPMAKYLRNELPETTEPVFEPTGAFRVWWKNRLFCFNRKNTHFWYSWLQGKRASLPAGVDMIEKTYQDHLKMLTSLDDGDDSVIEEIFQDPTFDYVIRKVRYQLTEGLKDPSVSFLNYTPSGSASYENTRRGLGQFGKLRDLAGLGTKDNEKDFCMTDEMIGMVEMRRCSPNPRYHQGTEIRTVYARCGQDSWSSLIEREREFPRSMRLRCVIQGVLEPFKVRVISKGESIPYYSMKPVQKVLHGIMRRWDCFRLIGRPFSPTDMVDLKERSRVTDEWFSVDYSAATDGLSFKYSGGILEEILRDVPPKTYRRAMQVLGMHDLYYPDKHEVYGYERVTSCSFGGTMTRGQLMGSILSFPILCLANLGVYLRVTQDLQKGWSHTERLRHVLVNGDDMLYAAPAELWGEHIRVGKAVGLNMSVGKSYHHKVYANVNSTSVQYRLDQKDDPYTIDFLNTGLYFGQHKVQGVVDGELTEEEVSALTESDFLKFFNEEDQRLILEVREDPGIVSSIGDLLKGALPGRAKMLLGEYLSLHKDKIRRMTLSLMRFSCKRWKNGREYKKLKAHRRNLFLPQSVGGMGVPCPPKFNFKVSSWDRKVATAMISKHQEGGYTTFSRPLPGREVYQSEEAVSHLRPLSQGQSTLIGGCSLSSSENRLKKSHIKAGVFVYLPVSDCRSNEGFCDALSVPDLGDRQVDWSRLQA